MVLSKCDQMCSIERSDVYLVNESSKLESVSRVYEIGEKSHSLLDRPRIWAWRPSWSCDLDHLYKLSFPLPKDAPYKVWL